MTTKDIAAKLVGYCKQGQFEAAQKELYANDATSTEPSGAQAPPLVTGLDKIIEKGHQFQAMIEKVHGISISDPVVAEDYFSISLVMDVDMKGMGRVPMSEICVYRVKDGKIVSEQFFYTTM